MSADHDKASVKDGGRLGAGSSDEIGEAVGDAFDGLRPPVVGKCADGLKAAPEIAAELETDRTVEVASVEDHGPSFIVKDNVFKPALDIIIAVKDDGAVAESGSIVIHGNKFPHAVDSRMVASGRGVSIAYAAAWAITVAVVVLGVAEVVELVGSGL